MELEDIIPTSKQINILYIQLKKRVHNISHKKIPSFQNHKLFIKNNPYRAWCIVKESKSVIGNVYVKFDNSIGLNCYNDVSSAQLKNILSLIKLKISPLKEKPSIRSKDFFINIASSNKSLRKKINSIGLVETQRTYILDDNNN